MKDKSEAIQPELNIGLVGHVDHGKTSLVSSLTAKWTDTHSEELKRGITIRLGYADASFYKYPEKKGSEAYGTNPISDNKKGKFLRKVSFIDAPGHETLMATMLSGAAIMDAALLLVSAAEPCPQPQTREHLMALEIVGIKDIIIVQNKIDLVTKEEALDNYKQIKDFVKGTIAESSQIIPVSAQHNININALIEAIETHFKTPKRDLTKDPIMFIARSFDVNKPGTPWESLVGGVLGGALKRGKLKINDEIEILPGIKEENKTIPVKTKISALFSGGVQLKELTPGGSIGVSTTLDPSIAKADALTGNVAGHPGKLPPVRTALILNHRLLQRVVGTKDELLVEPLKRGESLMINVNSSVSLGIVNELKKDSIHLTLKIPIAANLKDRVTLSRMIGARWRLIGYGEIIG